MWWKPSHTDTLVSGSKSSKIMPAVEEKLTKKGLEIFIWANLKDYNPENSLSESSEDYPAH